MTLTDRAASLFGEIAVAAGHYEGGMGRPPVYVVMPKAAAETLLTYFHTRGEGPVPAKVTADRLMMVSGLEVHIARKHNAPIRVG